MKLLELARQCGLEQGWDQKEVERCVRGAELQTADGAIEVPDELIPACKEWFKQMMALSPTEFTKLKAKAFKDTPVSRN